MNGRPLLALFIAAIPISVEMGSVPDTTRHDSPLRPHEHQTRLAFAGNAGQFAIIRRGCNGEVIDVAHTQLQSGALEVEQIFPNDLVIGARGGVVSDKPGTFERPEIPAPAPGWRDNVYFNPYVGVDDRRVSFALGYLHADHELPMGEDRPMKPGPTGHLVVRHSSGWVGLRFMEDLPLESEGYLTFETGVHANERVEAAAFVGMIGPFDGAMFGVKSRIWLTPAAALTLRGGVSGDDEYTFGAGLEARLGKH
ncbi:MAG: hypothetical protein U0704_05445 [Candidatus Eisenbacteria bacterium]